MTKTTKPKPSVWECIKIAYDKKRGMRLSGEDVDTLYLMDTAVRDAADNAAEDRIEREKRERLKS